MPQKAFTRANEHQAPNKYTLCVLSFAGGGKGNEFNIAFRLFFSKVYGYNDPLKEEHKP